MPWVFLKKPPLKFPSTYGLSDSAGDYPDLPPTPPGLPEGRIPNRIAEIVALLPRSVLPMFWDAVCTAERRDLDFVVGDWGGFAVSLHNAHLQEQVLPLIAQQRWEELAEDSVVQPPVEVDLAEAGRAFVRDGKREFLDGQELTWVEDEEFDDELHRPMESGAGEDPQHCAAAGAG